MLRIEQLQKRELMAGDLLALYVDTDASVEGAEYVVADNLPAGVELRGGIVTTHADADPADDVALLDVPGIQMEAVPGGSVLLATVPIVAHGSHLTELAPVQADELLAIELDYDGDGTIDALIVDELPGGTLVEINGEERTTTHADRFFGFEGFVWHFAYDDGDWRNAIVIDVNGDGESDIEWTSNVDSVLTETAIF